MLLFSNKAKERIENGGNKKGVPDSAQGLERTQNSMWDLGLLILKLINQMWITREVFLFSEMKKDYWID